jgi:hypothetical protein
MPSGCAGAGTRQPHDEALSLAINPACGAVRTPMGHSQNMTPPLTRHQPSKITCATSHHCTHAWSAGCCRLWSHFGQLETACSQSLPTHPACYLSGCVVITLQAVPRSAGNQQCNEPVISHLLCHPRAVLELATTICSVKLPLHTAASGQQRSQGHQNVANISVPRVASRVCRCLE